jgi:hypothetical protein
MLSVSTLYPNHLFLDNIHCVGSWVAPRPGLNVLEKRRLCCPKYQTSGIHRNLGGGASTNSVEDRGQREWGSGGGSPLVRGFGGSCNLVQEISYSKIFLIFGTLRLFMMTTNLFVIANVKQLRT